MSHGELRGMKGSPTVKLDERGARADAEEPKHEGKHADAKHHKSKHAKQQAKAEDDLAWMRSVSTLEAGVSMLFIIVAADAGSEAAVKSAIAANLNSAGAATEKLGIPVTQQAQVSEEQGISAAATEAGLQPVQAANPPAAPLPGATSGASHDRSRVGMWIGIGVTLLSLAADRNRAHVSNY